MIDPVDLFRSFLVAAAAALGADDASTDGTLLSENVYAVPDENDPLADFPPERRGIVIQVVPGAQPLTSVPGKGVASFYVRTYGNGARDAYALARWLYDLTTEVRGGRVRQRFNIPVTVGEDRRFIKWMMANAIPAATNDEDDRPIGFLNVTICVALYQ